MLAGTGPSLVLDQYRAAWGRRNDAISIGMTTNNDDALAVHRQGVPHSGELLNAPSSRTRRAQMVFCLTKNMACLWSLWRQDAWTQLEVVGSTRSASVRGSVLR